MSRLSEQIQIEKRFARSTSIERDIEQLEPLSGYLVTARALEVIQRISKVASRGQAGDAWSIVGPYGSGKSSLAILLDALFGPQGQLREQAIEMLRITSTETADQVNEAHKAYGTTEKGFVRALITSQREPVSHTLLRALSEAVTRFFGGFPDSQTFSAANTLKRSLAAVASDDARATGPSPADIVEIAVSLTKHAPLLLVVDEFGKNLEAIGDSAAADPYFLQQLAEAGQGTGHPIYLLTFQHLAFEDYAAASDDEIRRKEWSKVQGRFEDIPFVDSPVQTRALISTVFNVLDLELQTKITKWSQEQQSFGATLGTPDLGEASRLAACYPLHPITAAVLPELCREFGQNERTLFSFLTGPGDSAVPDFLLKHKSDKELPTVGLNRVYDYFMATGVLASSKGVLGRRWNEVTTRLQDSYSLTDDQKNLAKSIAVLNLSPTGGVVRASLPMLEMLFGNNTLNLLEDLESQSLVTFREFADEYRIWAGSDVNIETLVELELQYRERSSAIALLDEAHPLEEIVAARHSAEFETLRVFRRRYFDVQQGSVSIDPPEALDELVDGELLLIIGEPTGALPVLDNREYSKPVVAAVPKNTTRLQRAAQVTAALTAVAEHPLISSDRVAQREISERLAEAHSEFRREFEMTFDAQNCSWYWLNSPTDKQLHPGRGTSALSDVCDTAYSSTPVVRSEMLNRFKLTAQGAGARRRLLEAMIERGGQEKLGFEGYGPEMAMYLSVLKSSGIHQPKNGVSDLTFGAPTPDVDGAYILQEAWELLEECFMEAQQHRVNLKDIYAKLMSPPVGMKAGAIPVLLTAGLLAHRDQIAIYEHGTFVPVLSPPISERMSKNPGHFDVKHFANSSGARLEVLEALHTGLGISKSLEGHRVSNVLSVVTAVVRQIRALDNYTKKTAHLDPASIRLRETLELALEPDILVFESIPESCGLPPVAPNRNSYDQQETLASFLLESLQNLSSAADRMLDRLVTVLIEASGASNAQTVAKQASTIPDSIVEKLEPNLRAFVYALDTNVGSTDLELMKHLATVVARKDPAEWSDQDQQNFEYIQLPQICASFRRTLALHSEDTYNPKAVNVVLTRGDGSEDYRIISQNSEQQIASDLALTRALSELQPIFQSDNAALDGLLGAMADKFLPTAKEE